MSASRSTAILTALLVVASVAMVPMAASAEEHLSIEATQETSGELVVTVNGTDGPIAGATVNVTPTDPADTYVGAGEKDTDADGVATFAAPEEPVNVTITATNGTDSVTVTRELAVPGIAVTAEQSDDASVTVSVSDTLTGDPVEGANVSVNATDGTYAGEGEHVTDASGTVGLPAPSETVTVDIDAKSGEDTDSTTVTLKNQSALLEEESENFGQMVANFVAILRGDDSQVPWIGREVAKFVTENNPGNAPDHAGPKEGTGPASAGADAKDDEDRGPPADAGKPDHAGGNGGSDDADRGNRGGNGKGKGPK